MIGYFITGMNMDGKECMGKVLDKVRTAIPVGLRGQLSASAQTVPMPLDAYLVQDYKGVLHLVTPNFIKEVYPPNPQAIPADGLGDYSSAFVPGAGPKATERIIDDRPTLGAVGG